MDFKAHFIKRLETLPERTTFEFPKTELPEKHKKAAVLLPFWPNNSGGVDVVLTKRPDTMSNHPGQVSFPGGSVDEQDKSLQHAALRENQEELGIDPDHVRIMGRLDDAWSIAGHHVVPFVGWLEQRPQIIPNTREVAEVLIADVEMLMRPETACEHQVDRGKVIRVTQAFRWENGYVWGLTADLLMELLLWIKGDTSNRGEKRLNYLRQMQELGLNQ